MPNGTKVLWPFTSLLDGLGIRPSYQRHINAVYVLDDAQTWVPAHAHLHFESRQARVPEQSTTCGGRRTTTTEAKTATGTRSKLPRATNSSGLGTGSPKPNALNSQPLATNCTLWVQPKFTALEDRKPQNPPTRCRTLNDIRPESLNPKPVHPRALLGKVLLGLASAEERWAGRTCFFFKVWLVLFR